MADKELEDDDPFELVGVRIPVDPSIDADADMARCFVEEFALLGVPRERITQLFRSPFFAGTHAILESRGEAFVQGIIAGVFDPPAMREAS